MQSSSEDRMSEPVCPSPTSQGSNTTNSSSNSSDDVPFPVALVSGAIAGTTVDMTLFPLDTIKTRLQSPNGFQAAGGFRNIFKGVNAAFLGSAPGAALFFTTYETCKPLIKPLFHDFNVIESDQSGYQKRRYTNADTLTHMSAASIGETAACLVRVPTEVVKQRMQTLQYRSLSEALTTIFHSSPHVSGFYVGFGITVFREIPFSVIQFPLWERLKVAWLNNSESMNELPPYKGAICGAVAGGFAGAVTTPLDVIKTRTMLGIDRNGEVYRGVLDVFQRTVKNDGYRAFFNGVVPRTGWITAGGFCFFGAYEVSKEFLLPRWAD